MDKIISNLNPIFGKYAEINAVILFGSYVRGTQKASSDMDLALVVKNDNKLSPENYLKLISEIDSSIKVTPDIGYISSANLVYSYEAFTKGKVIYTRDEDYFNLLRCNLMGMYLNFNYERREVLNAYRA